MILTWWTLRPSSFPLSPSCPSVRHCGDKEQAGSDNLAADDEHHGDVKEARGGLHGADAAAVVGHPAKHGREAEAETDSQPEEEVAEDAGVDRAVDGVVRQQERQHDEERLHDQNDDKQPVISSSSSESKPMPVLQSLGEC
jgi:hypothetical protein